MNLYSRIDPTRLLHIIHRMQDVQDGRVDLIAPDQFIQCAALKMEQGKTFKAHRHVWKPGTKDVIAQESWVVIKGQVQVTLYDIDNSILHTDVLCAGDISITLEGGHNYLVMQDAVVYEYKTGPYNGQVNDKVFI